MCGAVVNGGVVVYEFLPFGEEKAIQHGLAALAIQTKIQIVSHPIALDSPRVHAHLTRLCLIDLLKCQMLQGTRFVLHLIQGDYRSALNIHVSHDIHHAS